MVLVGKSKNAGDLPCHETRLCADKGPCQPTSDRAYPRRGPLSAVAGLVAILVLTVVFQETDFRTGAALTDDVFPPQNLPEAARFSPPK